VPERDAWCPRRDQAYLGVLVDDLITRGVSEPYRMFTSRAEYRLSLREDNADLRLTAIGRQLGCVDDYRWDAFCRKRDAIERESERLKSTWVNPRIVSQEESVRVFGKPLEREYTLAELLRRPGVRYADVVSLIRTDKREVVETPVNDANVAEQVEISCKYAGYIARQQDEVARQEAHETTRIPATIDYRVVRGLSIEVRQKLETHRPETVGQAGRISGVTPAAVSLLIVHLKRLAKSGAVGQLAA